MRSPLGPRSLEMRSAKRFIAGSVLQECSRLNGTNVHTGIKERMFLRNRGPKGTGQFWTARFEFGLGERRIECFSVSIKHAKLQALTITLASLNLHLSVAQPQSPNRCSFGLGGRFSGWCDRAGIVASEIRTLELHSKPPGPARAAE